MKNTIIRDIRLFEEKTRGSFPSYIGERYSVNKSIHFLSARYSRKLRELDFITRDFHHLYIVQTPFLAEGEIVESANRPEKWMEFFYIGVSPELYNLKSKEEKENFTIKLITNVLNSIAISADQLKIVDQVFQNLVKLRSNLEINHLTKDTKKHTIIISYQIRPENKISRAFIKCLDKKTGITRKSILIELKSYEDIFYIVSTISESNGIIILKPRNSETANFHIKSYETPLKINIDEMPII
ncbi:hypothetical protein FHS16_006442 [Paenibacillus endophyticus]|uniref:Uncharacterized protein n=1 Tax=Paenibacillus endophyticus TaxID=1294268 RepID=A0A7W5CFK9_9BACL|nr:hypothetical protein [Paenibacillus endophyticus]MBB3156314.1 hypothetical protein [Paenibacillus endophyticus]